MLQYFLNATIGSAANLVGLTALGSKILKDPPPM
ncbi:hypothetical protein M2284_001082 [Rhodococcus sp. LBL1]|nr:hypothetical protein [Rhodococcus sp. LBL1]MDH6682823.1 hypothetical protein [Rhodococcus sp. LBL2]